MAYDIRLAKLVNGDLVIGKFDAEGSKLTEVVAIQTVPTQQGVQVVLLPFGYPFEQEIEGELDWKFVMYEYKTIPEDMQQRYLEAVSNITIASPGMSNLDLGGGMGGAPGDLSGLFKK